MAGSAVHHAHHDHFQIAGAFVVLADALQQRLQRLDLVRDQIIDHAAVLGELHLREQRLDQRVVQLMHIGLVLVHGLEHHADGQAQFMLAAFQPAAGAGKLLVAAGFRQGRGRNRHDGAGQQQK